MENKNDDFPIKLLALGVVAYGAFQAINAVVAAITAFLMGLVHIALGIVAILALYWVYRHITDKQYGETKKIQQIAKLEQERKLHTAKLPKHLKDQADEYYKERQRAYYNLKTYSRADAFLDRTKQVFQVLRKKSKDQ